MIPLQDGCFSAVKRLFYTRDEGSAGQGGAHPRSEKPSKWYEIRRLPLGRFGLFGRRFRIVWIQASGSHDGTTEFLSRNRKLARRSSGDFVCLGSNESVASADHGLQVMWLVGVVIER